MSWENAWQEGRTRWDAGQAAPALVKLIQDGDLPTGHVLVPGCGSGYDAFALVHEQRNVIGMDIAPTAAKRFHSLREQHGLSTEQVDLLTEDFFTFEPKQPFDLIWDYTFLCAIPPDTRTRWAETMARLLAPEGELITLIFPVGGDFGDGPPHQVTPALVEDLLTPVFTRISLEPVTQSHPGREGKEFLARWRKAR